MKSIFEHQTPANGEGILIKEYIQPYFTSPFHFHDLYELIYIKKSYGKVYAGRSVKNFKEGEIFLFSPDFGHCFYNEKEFVEQGQLAHAIAIFFKKDLLGEGFFEQPKFVRINEIFTKSRLGLRLEPSDTEILKLFENIPQQNGIEELITFLSILNKISKYPSKYFQVLNDDHIAIKLTNSDPARLDPVIQYIMDNFRNEVDSKTAAKMVHLNHSAFCRYFKSRTEQTFSQFVNQVRVTHATTLLLTKGWDILRISYECGFKNLSYFNRQFKEITGLSPTEYKKEYEPDENNLLMDSQED